MSNTAETTQRGVLEIEYGVEASAVHSDMNGLLKFGATRDLELRISSFPVQSDSAAHATGVGDVQFGIKYRFLHQAGRRPTISAQFTAELPTAAAAFGSTEADYFALVMVSKDFGKHHLDFNTQAQFFGRPHATGYDVNCLNALAWSYQLTKRWGVDAEISGYTRQNAANPAELQTMFNATYNVSPRLVLDAGVATRIFGNAPRALFIAGVTYSIADLYKRHVR